MRSPLRRDTAKTNARRGFTLVELVVVMAVLVVVSALVISFTMLTSDRLEYTADRADFLDSAVSLKSDLRKSFAELDGQGANTEIGVEVRDNVLYIENSQILSLAEYENIDSFEIETNGKILKVILENTATKSKTSFILTSRTGNTFKEVSE